MMTPHQFDKVINRYKTNSLKWDALEERFGKANVLPLWVADMDFRAPNAVIEALKKVAEHGIFGYTVRPDSFYESLISWFERRHDWKIKKDSILVSPGIVPALSLLVQAFTEPGDHVIIQSPVYHPFFHVVQQNGRNLIDNPLILNDKKYEINFDDLEQKLREYECKLMLFCSPHNPAGRVWTKKELIKVGELCKKYNVLLISDEIHCDLIYKGHQHIPFASLSKEFQDLSITCVAPSKTFNLAGLQSSALIIPNKDIREQYKRSLKIENSDMLNSFAIAAFEAAYNDGEQWLENLMEYLEDNVQFLISFFEEQIPEVNVIPPEGTYLIWLDFRKLGLSVKELESFLLTEAKVALNQGYIFGKTGEGFVRINIACPRKTLEEGLHRIKLAVNTLKNT
ncbi:MalY/PatB family protein [Pueribacillus sp. YX66]|uniref:MalY/PatB family protein n=1 Tax=Pueribacillus sp. YX66 TaxID=3229242 RepID=UPI0036D34851